MKNPRSALIVLALLASSALRAEDLTAIQWSTNETAPLIGSEKAKRGGTITFPLYSYPLTFRLYGPNNNDSFASWNRSFGTGFSLVGMHRTTDEIIPVLATHWSVQDDHKTVYYKLDPDARWSDGKPVTADDYTYTWEFLNNDFVNDPFAKQVMNDYFEKIEKVDTYTIKLVGKRPSWKPLLDFNISPTPRHATKLDAEWVARENNVPPVVVGPYTISDSKSGEYVEFRRIANWWGDKKRTFAGQYNVDKIRLIALTDQERDLDFLRKGQLSVIPINRAGRWANEMDLDEIKKGWMHRKKVYLELPDGVSGLCFNLKQPIFQNKDFRKALQHLLDFETLNEKIMFNAYFRKVSLFEGTPFANPDLKPYGYNPKMARELLMKAGFTKRGEDGILVNAAGQRASFSLNYSTKSFERHLTVMQNTFKRAGVEMKLQLLEPGAMFQKALEKAHEATMISMTSGLYPEPHQYFHSSLKDQKQNNNFWAFGSPETDELIDTYRFDMNEEKRIAALRKLDAVVQDEAFYLPFWSAPYMRLAYWDYVQFPEFFLPRRTEQLTDSQVWWVDVDRQKALAAAMKEGRALAPDMVVDVDPYGVKARLDAASKTVEPAR